MLWWRGVFGRGSKRSPAGLCASETETVSVAVDTRCHSTFHNQPLRRFHLSAAAPAHVRLLHVSTSSVEVPLAVAMAALFHSGFQSLNSASSAYVARRLRNGWCAIPTGSLSVTWNEHSTLPTSVANAVT